MMSRRAGRRCGRVLFLGVRLRWCVRARRGRVREGARGGEEAKVNLRRGTQCGARAWFTDLPYHGEEHLDHQLSHWTPNEEIRSWVKTQARLCSPARVHLVDGSEAENTALLAQMVHSGMMIKLNDAKRPNSYLARSDVGDVARVEGRTFICSEREVDAGPTNNWWNPKEARETMEKKFTGSMRGRTMYVIPFSMGPLGSPISKCGVQVTDSPYVVVNSRIMTRMGKGALDVIGATGEWVKALHSVGAPLTDDVQRKVFAPDSAWPSSSDKYITHFPETREIVSYGSGYGGNALLGKKCFALRIASVQARDEGSLAEHMLILKITNPAGKVRYLAAAFPSACGKTNLAMLQPTVPGWKVETVGDDIAWMRYGEDGRLRAINPEAGFFGVAPGTSFKTNKAAMDSMRANSIFTNVAMTPDGDVWWEGMTDKPPTMAVDWLRRTWTPESGRPAAHPNSRFTAPAAQCPIIAKEWDNPAGVPISAILFGGRRRSTVPLVYQSLDFNHGVFVGASMMSETTAAAEGAVGDLRADPFAMKPFMGYSVVDYVQHWLNVGAKAPRPDLLPKIFMVNWFRRDAEGKFVWPGFGDNARVLAWIFDRCEALEAAKATTATANVPNGPPSIETPIGIIPDVAKGGINLDGLNIPTAKLADITSVKPSEWSDELVRYYAYHKSWARAMPDGLRKQHDRLRQRLGMEAIAE